jgi:hypothetical protein
LCFCIVLCCVGRGLCDELITRPDESYHVSNKIKNFKNGRPGHCMGRKSQRWRWFAL